MKDLTKEVKLYFSDSLEYAGSIIHNGKVWEFKDVEDEHLIKVTKGLALKGVLANLIYFNLVYDIIV